MTLFEKIYFTIAVFNAFLAFAGATIKIVYNDERNKIGWKIGTIFTIPALVQAVFLAVGEGLICKIILTGIWELDVSMFPSLWR